MFRNRVELMGALASMSTGGIFDRHPKPHRAFLEGATEWAPARRIGTEP
ncbi:MAG TPA: hypothetical protein VKG22_09770 [Stellaceae bacterium]|nr:hypothetical protein [Stellaceae bacterium]